MPCAAWCRTCDAYASTLTVVGDFQPPPEPGRCAALVGHRGRSRTAGRPHCPRTFPAAGARRRAAALRRRADAVARTCGDCCRACWTTPRACRGPGPGSKDCCSGCCLAEGPAASGTTRHAPPCAPAGKRARSTSFSGCGISSCSSRYRQQRRGDALAFGRQDSSRARRSRSRGARPVLAAQALDHAADGVARS